MTTGDGASTLEHLAEMDRLLREIQVELAPEREPAPALEATPQPSRPEPQETVSEPEASPPVAEPEPPPPAAESPPPAAESPPPAAESPPPAEPTPPPAEPEPPPLPPTPPLPPSPPPPVHDAPEARASPTAPPPNPRAPDPQLTTVAQLATYLLASMRELLDGYEQFLLQIRTVDAPPSPGPRPARAPTTSRREDPAVTVAAGPFPSLDALREFEAAVSRLPGVRDVAVRGYEGADRAIIEVRLENGEA